MMSQTTAGAQGPTDNRGGVNPQQVGLGSQLGTIDNLHTQGFLQTTENPLDLALEGDGMFVLDTPEGRAYTRAGNFYLDHNQHIVTADGHYLLNSEEHPINIPPEAKSINVEKDGTVNYVDEDGSTEEAGRIALALFSNPGGLEKIGGNLFLDNNNAGL